MSQEQVAKLVEGGFFKKWVLHGGALVSAGRPPRRLPHGTIKPQKAARWGSCADRRRFLRDRWLPIGRELRTGIFGKAPEKGGAGLRNRCARRRIAALDAARSGRLSGHCRLMPRAR